MNTLAATVFACLVVFASAKPSLIHGGWAGAWGAHDDGQWHGEGLLEAQDWAGDGGWAGHGAWGGHGAAIVAPGAAVIAPSASAAVVGGHGLGLGLGLGLGHGLGHGGVVVAGPAGAVVSNTAHGAIGIGHGHW